jgi:transposase
MKVSGLDIHKDTIFCGIYNGKKQSEVKEFTTLTPDIVLLGTYLQSEGVKKVAMESTGIYWIPIWNILESMGFELMLVNPFLIKQMPGRKSDVKDAQWIAQLLHKGLLRGSLIPNDTIRELRTYSRRYVKLTQRLTGLLQTMERNLEMCSIRISSYLSNLSGKTFINIVKLIISGETDAAVLLKKVHGRIRNRHGRDTIISSLTGFITEHHKFILEQLLEEYEMISSQIEKTFSKMEDLVNTHYSEEKALLCTIPGISNISAIIILAETGADMKVFETSNKFSGWTGLRPRNDESAGKYKSTATTKGNRFLRSVLVQVAWAATRTKGSYFKEKYNKLVVRKSRKKALIAIARKIGVVIWNVLAHKERFNPNKLPVYDPVKLKAKQAYHQKEYDRLVKLLKNA